MRLFDSYVFVDWSSRSRPSPVKESRDSIWVGEASAQSEGVVPPHYYRTRCECMKYIT